MTIERDHIEGVVTAGAALLGASLQSYETLAGGDLSQIALIRLVDGREAVVKTGPAPAVEGSMLRALAEAGAPAPRVLAASDDVLVLEPLAGGGSLDAAWENLGSVLARIHAATAASYGWSRDFAFGRVTIENTWSDDWPAFWGRHRLLAHCAHVDSQIARRLEALAADLPQRLPAKPAPALLHGDLWRGNILVDGQLVSGLIDPACYYGHCEADFSMLTLFDRPAESLFASYGSFEPGYEERLVIYRLWPALVHLRLFGGSYRGMVERLLAEAGV